MEWELLLTISLGESRRDSSAMFVPLRASSSRAMRVKAASTFWASLAEVSRTASTPLLSASVHASSNSTCLWAWRSDLLPVVGAGGSDVMCRCSGEKKPCKSTTTVRSTAWFWSFAYRWGSAPRWQLRNAPPPWSSGKRTRKLRDAWCRRPPRPRGRCGSSSEWWCGIAPVPLCPIPASATGAHTGTEISHTDKTASRHPSPSPHTDTHLLMWDYGEQVFLCLTD